MPTGEHQIMRNNSGWTILKLMLLLFFLHLRASCVMAQGDFLSIDCGGNMSYTDTKTGIRWVPDSDYIQHGVGHSSEIKDATSLSSDYATLRALRTLRFFPKPLTKSCYQLSAIPNVTYLLRVLSFYGNYDGKHNNSITFYVSAETAGTLWHVYTTFNDDLYIVEGIVSSLNDTIYVCLMPYPGYREPFISSIELRPFSHGMYRLVRPGTALILRDRYDFGANSSNLLRYPKDPFDRIWLSDINIISCSATTCNRSYSEVPISTHRTEPDLPPLAVMQTALVYSTTAPPLSFRLNVEEDPDEAPYSPVEVLILCYFAETERRNKSETRILDLQINNRTKTTQKTINMPSQGPKFSAIETQIAVKIEPIYQLNFSLSMASASSRGVMLNALEHYTIARTQQQTWPEDVGALALIGKTFDMKGWIADPCYIVPWNGIACDQPSSAVRVSQLDLSGKSLKGTIPSSIGRLTALINMSLDNNHLEGELPVLSNLTKLERLHLQNNNFSGNLPLWLFTLKNLKELSLDNNSLTGTLPDTSNLTKLEILHLQNNRLSGLIPDWLSQLNHLKELYLDNNNFNGTIPLELLKKCQSLKLRILSGNAQLTCGVKNIPSCSICPQSQSNKENLKVVVGVTTAAVLLITLALVIVFIVYRKKYGKKQNANKHKRRSVLGNQHDEDYSLVRVPDSSKSRGFTLDELMAATNNFSRQIGKGGFGPVFFGKLQDGKDIAVKVLSLLSRQGAAQFLNEVDLLSRVNHKNLVSLLGYCNESRELMLIYEHMSGGSLKDHLYGSAADLSNLDWKTRLKIALDAAQGLEYLHVKCTPKIIHRDVKPANILLDSNLTGKLSDFGLSRMTFNEGVSHVTTTAKGTPGYWDPEYFSTHMLTEKSDVYSFGVVLLEIICGRQPIDGNLPEDQINLIRWVTPYVEADEDPGKLAEIVDKRLNSDYDMKSVSHVAKLSIRCVQNNPSLRPNISEIVAEIKEAIRFQPDIAAAFVSEEIERNFEDLQASSASTSLNLDSSNPKEFDSSNSSHSIS